MKDNKSILDTPLAKWIMAIVTILSLGWAIFQTYRIRAPKLQYEIVSQVRLFNKTNDLPKVTLLVDTVDVLKDNQNVSFYVIKVQNVGNQHLRSNDYDEGKFGISIGDGEILRDVNLIEACTQHIANRYNELKPSYTEHYIEIPHIALDRKEWYSISFAVIHTDSISPSLLPVGKIIGQKNLEVRLYSEDVDNMTFSEKLFVGSIWVNVVRALIYLVISIVIIFFVAYAISTISENRENKKEGKIKNAIAQDHSISDFMRDDYMHNFETNISKAQHYYTLNDSRLNDIYQKVEKYILKVGDHNFEDFDMPIRTYQEINSLIKNGYIVKNDDGKLTIPTNARSSLDKILNLLQDNGRSLGNIYWRNFDWDKVEDAGKEV
jgi:ABC-type glycerol-3-phosphate transport system permease component